MTTTVRPPIHVDRHDLFHDLPTRIAYLKDVLEFDSADVEALIAGQPYIRRLLPAIVNLVYKKLLRHDITARVFSTRDSRDETDPEFWVKEEGPQIQNRKMFLRWYLTKLNMDPSNMEYWEYLDMVGAMHVGKARRSALFVDYVFLGSMLGYIQSSFTEAILSHPRLDLESKIGIVKAIGKIIWIQNDLMVRWQLKNENESAMASERASLASGETDVLGRLPSEMSESTCPFSGTTMKTTDLHEQRRSLHTHENPDPSPITGPPSGIPKMSVVNGKIVGREKLSWSFIQDEA